MGDDLSTMIEALDPGKAADPGLTPGDVLRELAALSGDLRAGRLDASSAAAGARLLGVALTAHQLGAARDDAARELAGLRAVLQTPAARLHLAALAALFCGSPPPVERAAETPVEAPAVEAPSGPAQSHPPSPLPPPSDPFVGLSIWNQVFGEEPKPSGFGH